LIYAQYQTSVMSEETDIEQELEDFHIRFSQQDENRLSLLDKIAQITKNFKKE